MRETELRIPSRRGSLIPATLVLPDGTGPFPIVALIHGFAGSRQEGGGYPREAEALARTGIGTIRMDFAGCGDSTESFRHGTLLEMVSDVASCMDYACAHFPVDRERMGLQGFSLGGRVVMEILNGGVLPAAAVMLMSPAADNSVHASLFGSEEGFLAACDQAKRDGLYRFFDELFQKWLELDADWFTQLLERDTLGQARPFPGPMQVVWAADDGVIPPEVSRKAAAAYGAELVEVTGDGHSYGHYSDRADILRRLIDCQCSFFSRALLR